MYTRIPVMTHCLVKSRSEGMEFQENECVMFKDLEGENVEVEVEEIENLECRSASVGK